MHYDLYKRNEILPRSGISQAHMRAHYICASHTNQSNIVRNLAKNSYSIGIHWVQFDDCTFATIWGGWYGTMEEERQEDANGLKLTIHYKNINAPPLVRIYRQTFSQTSHSFKHEIKARINEFLKFILDISRAREMRCMHSEAAVVAKLHQQRPEKWGERYFWLGRRLCRIETTMTPMRCGYM